MSIQATRPNVKTADITSNTLSKSEYVLKVNNIPEVSTPTSKASRINPYNLPSTRVKNVKRKRRLILLSLFFLLSFSVAVFIGYSATYEIYNPGTTLIHLSGI